MNFCRPAAVLFASLIVLSACDRPDRDADRSERGGRSEHSWDDDQADRRDEREDSRSTESASAPSSSQTRDVEPFDSIELRGAAELLITVGPASSLKLDASERTLKSVETRVKGDTLIIDVTKSRGWFSDQGHLKIVVTTPALKSLESNGAGDIEITGLNGGEQTLELAGAHNVKAEGRLDKLIVELSGAGNVDYHKVIADDARVTVNGAGNVEVNTTESLRAEVNGVGAVRYSGNPAKVESELHGLGAITRREGDRQLSDKTNSKKTEEGTLQVEK